MEIEQINIHSLPFLIIPERENLPKSGGVYFVLSANNDVEYIGKAKDLNKRWRKHECCIDLDSPKTCRVAWLEISSEEERTDFEKQLIRKFRPKLNLNFVIQPTLTISKIALMTSEELKNFREKLGLSQEQLSKHLKVARNTVSRWELGERKIPEFLDLALRTVERDLSEKEAEN